MKQFFSTLIAVLITINVFAQSPDKMSYQAVVRDVNNNLVTNQAVGMKISILQGSISGTSVYEEIFNPNPVTNTNGLITVEIGGGIPVLGNFATIDWSLGSYFVKTETDPTGGTNYTITGVSQLLSVPYALYAKTAGNFLESQILSISNDTIYLTGGSFVKLPAGFSGDYNDLTNQPTIPTVPTNVSAFTNDAGYLTSFTESQIISISNDTIYLTGGSFVKLPAGFSGDYNDLINKPSIPTNISELTNDAGYVLGRLPNISTFSNVGNNSFVVPANVNYLYINFWGAAGSGSNDDINTNYTTPYSGGGGGYFQGYVYVTPGDVLTFVIGSGGASTNSDGNGFDGGNSYIKDNNGNDLVTIIGGKKGTNNNSAPATGGVVTINNTNIVKGITINGATGGSRSNGGGSGGPGMLQNSRNSLYGVASGGCECVNNPGGQSGFIMIHY